MFSNVFSIITDDQIIYTDNTPEDNAIVHNIPTAQTIYYGCPGTGKSFEVKKLSEGEHGEKTYMVLERKR